MRFFVITHFILCFVSASLLGQNNEESLSLTLSGQIIAAEDNIPVPFVHIVNNNTKQGTVSNTEGRFWITMSQNDSVVFSAIGFESYVFTLKKPFSSNEVNVTISLNMASMELEPVKISAYKNEQAFKRAILDLDVPLDEGKNMKIPGVRYGKSQEVKPGQLVTTGNGIGINGPISAIAGLISKRGRQEKKLHKFKAEYTRRRFLMSKYNRKMVIEITGLEEADIDAFMNFCKLSDGFIEAASEYEIVTAIHQCYRRFETVVPTDH